MEIDSKCLVNYLKCLSKCMRYWRCLNYYGVCFLICGNVRNWSKDKEINSDNEVIGILKIFFFLFIFVCFLIRIIILYVFFNFRIIFVLCSDIFVKNIYICLIK